MKTSTKWLPALALLALLTSPAILHAQTWPWAVAPIATNAATSSVTAMATDAAGNTVVTGYFTGSLTFGSTILTSQGGNDIFVARLNNSTGAWTQAVQVGSASNDVPTALAIDASGNVVVGGWFNSSVLNFGAVALANGGSPGTADVFVARLSSTGTWTQAARAGGADNDFLNALAVDGNGTVVAGGTFSEPTAQFGPFTLTYFPPNGGTWGNIFVARLSSAGTWTQAVRAGGQFGVVLTALAVDATGTVTTAGYFDSPTLNFGSLALPNPKGVSITNALFVARLNNAGTWTQAVSSDNTSTAIPTAGAVDAGGTAVIGGWFMGQATTFGATTLANANPNGTSQDIFVARLGPAGTWTSAARAGGVLADVVRALTLDSNGNALVAGYFTGPTASFGPLTLTNANPATGINARADVFVARLGAGGSWDLAMQAGGQDSDQANAIALDRNGAGVAIGGDITGAATFGSLPLSTTGSNAFVARLTGSVLAARPGISLQAGTLVPNPANGAATLLLAAAPDTRPVQLLDAQGCTVRTYHLPARATATIFDLRGLAPGLYVARCGAASGKLLVE